MSCPHPSAATKVNRLSGKMLPWTMGHEGPGREEERLGCGDRSACWPLLVWGRLLAWCWVNSLLVLCVLVALPSVLAPVDRLLFFFHGDRGDLLSRLSLVVWLPPRVCLSLCVLPVVLPYGRLRHAVLPQGRTTDRIPGHPLHRRDSSSAWPQTAQQPRTGPPWDVPLLV